MSCDISYFVQKGMQDYKLPLTLDALRKQFPEPIINVQSGKDHLP